MSKETQGQTLPPETPSRFSELRPGIYLWNVPEDETAETVQELFDRLEEILAADNTKRIGLVVDLVGSRPPDYGVLKKIQRNLSKYRSQVAYIAFLVDTNELVRSAATIAVKTILKIRFGFYRSQSQALESVQSQLKQNSGFNTDGLKNLSWWGNPIIRITSIGVTFGLMFPLIATSVLVAERQITWWEAQTSTGWLIWIIDTAPLFLGVFAYLIGQRQAELMKMIELNRYDDQEAQFDFSDFKRLYPRSQLVINFLLGFVALTLLGLSVRMILLPKGTGQESASYLKKYAPLKTEVQALAKHLVESDLALKRMADRHISDSRESEISWSRDAKNYVDHFETFSSISWVDLQGNWRWSYPKATSKLEKEIRQWASPRLKSKLFSRTPYPSVYLYHSTSLENSGLVLVHPTLDSEVSLTGALVSIVETASLLPNSRPSETFIEVLVDGQSLKTFPTIGDLIFKVDTTLLERSLSIAIRSQIGSQRYTFPLQWDNVTKVILLFSFLVSGAAIGVFHLMRINRVIRGDQNWLLEAVDQGIASVGLDFKISFINPALSALLGYSREELRGRDIHELLHRDQSGELSCENTHCLFLEAIREGETRKFLDFQVWRHDGQHIWVNLEVTPVLRGGHLVGSVFSFENVTERKMQSDIRRGVAAIREAYINSSGRKEDFYRSVLETFILVSNSQWGAFLEIHRKKDGLPYGEEVSAIKVVKDADGLRFQELGQKEKQEFKELREVHEWSFYKGKTVIENDRLDSRYLCLFTIFNNDEMTFQIALLNTTIPYRESEIVELQPMMESLSSIYSLNRAEEESRRLAELVRKSGVAVVGVDLNGLVTTWNEKASEVFGWKDFEIIGKSIGLVSPDHLKSQSRDLINQVVVRDNFQCETVWLAKDRMEIPVEIYLSAIKDRTGQIVSIAFYSIDIREKKKIENQLLHAARLASMGEIAAGVGHEINNPLAIANGNVERIKMLIANNGVQDPRIDDCFAKYRTASWRIANIVQGLRTFSHPQTESNQIFDFVDAVNETLLLIKEIYEKDEVRLEWQEPDGTLWVKGNRGRILQALLNLLSNAKDAVEDTKNKIVRLEMQSTLGSVTLKIIDQGRGIPDDQKAKVFDAFYTTKDVGRGTGIGLSLTRTIVHEHGGEVSFDSSESGTTFVIELPLSLKSQDQIDVNEARSSSGQLGFKVLVVDDEEGIREILRDLLEDAGCEVIEAQDGRVALKKIDQHQPEIIFTDLKMPEMDGVEMIGELRARENFRLPKIVVITGAVRQVNAKQDEAELLAHVDAVVLKPFDEGEILSILEDFRRDAKPQALSA